VVLAGDDIIHPTSLYRSYAVRKNWLMIRLTIVVLVILGTPFLRYTKTFVADEEKEKVKQLVDSLHQRLAQGDADAIYEDADSDFKSQVPLARHRLYIAQVVRIDGTPGDCQEDGIWAKYGFFYKKLMIRCYSQFSKGAVQEVYVWRKENGQYLLSALDIK
jgi:hypothetical protein